MSEAEDADRMRRLRSIFHQALDLEPTQREALLERECAEDRGLLSELRVLIQGALTTDEFLVPPGTRTATAVDAPVYPTQVLRVGRFVLEDNPPSQTPVQTYSARDEQGHGVHLLVASIEDSDHGLVKRLRAQASILEQLEHPALASLVELGLAEDPIHSDRAVLYLATRRSGAGAPLPDRVALRQLNGRDRFDLVGRVAEAFVYAHGQLAWHTALAPSSVWIDSVGQPQIIDLGFARILQRSGQGDPAAMVRRDVEGLLELLNSLFDRDDESPAANLARELASKPARFQVATELQDALRRALTGL